MIPDSGSVKEERDLVSRLILLFVVGLMLLFGIYGVCHLLYVTSADPSLLPYIRFVLAFGLIAAVICGLAILKRKHWHMERAVAVSVFLLGLLYMFAMTPLSIPDEPHHYQSAYQLSNVFCFQWDRLEYGRASDFDYTGFSGHYNVSSAYRQIADNIRVSEVDDTQQIIPSPRALSYPVEYLPQAIGISLGRLFRASFIVTFFLGRLFNLLLYVVCVYLAVRTVPKFKLLFGLIGILPMALHQAASYSYDGFINGMSLLLIALMLRAIWRKDPFDKKEAALIIIVGMLVAPAKFVQSLFLLLFFLIPQERFHNKKQRMVFTMLALGLPLLLTCLLQLPSLTATAFQSGEKLNWEGGVNYTTDFIVRNPLRALKIFYRTFFVNAVTWFEGSIGTSLSGLTLPIKSETIYAFVLLLLISSWETDDMHLTIRSREKVWFIGISLLVVFLTMLYLFLTWTTNTRDIVAGVQGRYFITILPLIFLSLNNRTIMARQTVAKPVLFGAAALNIHVILQVLTYTVCH